MNLRICFTKFRIERKKMRNGQYNNLKTEFFRNGVTQTEVAQFLDMSPTNLGLKLRGKVTITVDELCAMRDEFCPDATLDYLAERKPDENR